MGFSDADATAETVPDLVIARAKAAFRQRTVGDVAAMVFDSLLDGGDQASSHQLRFEHRRLRLELWVSAQPEGTSLCGRAQPAMARRVEVETDSGGVIEVVPVGEDGAFTVDGLGHGVIRLTVYYEDADAVHTDWFRV